MKPYEQTRAYRTSKLYETYVEKHEAKMSQWKPERLNWEDAYKISQRIIAERPSKRSNNSKTMANGPLMDRSGVYEIDGEIYDFCEFSEFRGGLSSIIVYKYESMEAWYNFTFPLPKNRYFG